MAKRVPVTSATLGSTTSTATPLAPPAEEPAPFGVEFQGMLLKVMLGDAAFARGIQDHVKPSFFQNSAMAWAWSLAQDYQTTYGATPTIAMLLDQARRLPTDHAPIYEAVIAQVRDAPVTDEDWLRQQTLEWVRKNVFMRAFYDVRDLWNAGQRTDAYDNMRTALTVVDNVSWSGCDRGWYNREEFAQRHMRRQDGLDGRAIGTGFPTIDAILEGGARPGFAGTWIAYPKVGKTTLLTNLGATACRSYHAKTLHIVLEGSRPMVEARYDAIFTGELYSNVKAGVVDAAKYAAAVTEMDYARNSLVIRGFTETWDTNILHIDEEIRDLKTNYGWDPEMIILDYGDLLRGRPKQGGYFSETAEQQAAFKDIKSLANKGYRIWTASQAQRPKTDDFAEKAHNLRSKDIADCYAKVRVLDFIGSLNQTNQERQQERIRLYSELYRDNAADITVEVEAKFKSMTFGSELQPLPGQATTTPPKKLGYAQTTNGL